MQLRACFGVTLVAPFSALGYDEGDDSEGIEMTTTAVVRETSGSLGSDHDSDSDDDGL